jgi:solute carrier family 30 (zinc transporter), member 5/7
MAASYVLPASAMTHGHHAHAQSHSHPHSHSQSPSRSHAANAPRSLKQQRPNGTLHSYSYSEALHEYNREYASHRESDAAPQAQRPAYSAGPSGLSEEHRPPQLDSYDPPRIDTDIPLPSHEHHHHPHGHSHVSIVSVEPRSRFTNFILPFVLRWPLVHTIMADKDSRRIFYFMR